MNTPAPTPPPSGNAAATTARVTAPTLGSIIGATGGSILAAKLKIVDPVEVGSLVTVVTAVVTALFHWVGSKIGISLE